MVGKAMAIDLAKKHQVTLTDLSKEALSLSKEKCSELATQQLDVTSSEFTKVLEPFDLVICAVPGFLGFETLKKIIETGKDGQFHSRLLQ